MRELLFTVTFIANVQVTGYRSLKSQTDSSPYRTSINERTNVHGIAVSQNLLSRWGGKLHYGDLVYVDEVGFKFVNDVMNPRHKDAIDIWVETKDQEKAIFHKFKNKKVKIWLIKRQEEIK